MQDIEKLEAVVKDQEAQIEELKHEIKMLKTKGLPPAPIGERVADEAAKSSSKDSQQRKWSEYDSYIEDETTVSDEKHFIQEIKIPA